MTKKAEKNQAEKEFDFSSIPKPVLEKISAYASQRGIDMFNEKLKEYKSKSRDFRHKNARLLMKKYRWLKTYSGNAVSELTQLLTEEDIAYLESMGLENLETTRVASIKDRVAFTQIVLTHIDTMLDVYKNRCLASDRDDVQRRWRVLHSMYIAEVPTNAEDLAEMEYVNVRTIFRDLDSAVDELSGLFFGIDFSDLIAL